MGHAEETHRKSSENQKEKPLEKHKTISGKATEYNKKSMGNAYDKIRKANEKHG